METDSGSVSPGSNPSPAALRSCDHSGEITLVPNRASSKATATAPLVSACLSRNGGRFMVLNPGCKDIGDVAVLEIAQDAFDYAHPVGQHQGQPVAIARFAISKGDAADHAAQS